MFDARNNHVHDDEQNRGEDAKQRQIKNVFRKTLAKPVVSSSPRSPLPSTFLRHSSGRVVQKQFVPSVHFLATANATHFDPSTFLAGFETRAMDADAAAFELKATPALSLSLFRSLFHFHKRCRRHWLHALNTVETRDKASQSK